MMCARSRGAAKCPPLGSGAVLGKQWSLSPAAAATVAGRLAGAQLALRDAAAADVGWDIAETCWGVAGVLLA